MYSVVKSRGYWATTKQDLTWQMRAVHIAGHIYPFPICGESSAIRWKNQFADSLGGDFLWSSTDSRGRHSTYTWESPTRIYGFLCRVSWIPKMHALDSPKCPRFPRQLAYGYHSIPHLCPTIAKTICYIILDSQNKLQHANNKRTQKINARKLKRTRLWDSWDMVHVVVVARNVVPGSVPAVVEFWDGCIRTRA